MCLGYDEDVASAKWKDIYGGNNIIFWGQTGLNRWVRDLPKIAITSSVSYNLYAGDLPAIMRQKGQLNEIAALRSVSELGAVEDDVASREFALDDHSSWAGARRGT